MPASDAAVRPAVPAPARVWRSALRGLTWRRYAGFVAATAVIALSESRAINALMGDGSWQDKLVGTLKPWVYVLLMLTPVLLAVVFVDNRGPAQGRARVLWLAAAVVGGQAAGTLLWALAMPVLYPDGPRPDLEWVNDQAGARARYYVGSSVIMLSISAVATTFWYFLRRSHDLALAVDEERLGREMIEQERAEALLTALQAQVEPHFLFNTLASVRRLYETDPASGREMLRHLVSYLTSSLPALRDTRPTLGRELALAVAYLKVHQIRLGARLSVAIDVPEALRHAPVPPMMLATLVENAIIHGINPLPAGGAIRISARTERASLLVEVADTGRGIQDAWGGGVGLANIRARLASEFGDAAELRLVEGPGRGFVATLVLPHLAETRAA